MTPPETPQERGAGLSPQQLACLMLLTRSETSDADTEEMLRVLVAYARSFDALHPIERMQFQLFLDKINSEYRATNPEPLHSTWFD